MTKTYLRLRERYYWEGMYADTSRWVQRCERCAVTSSKSARAPLIPIVPGAPFHRIGMDFIGPLPRTSNGKKYAIVFCDYATRWAEVRAVAEATAETAAQALIDEIVTRHGVPEILLSDQGAQFTAKVYGNVAKLLGAKQHFATAYHPQTDGLVERLNQTLKNSVRHFCNTRATDWDRWLRSVLFAYNTSVQESTGESPFFLLYGRDPHLPTVWYARETRDDFAVPASEYKDKLLGALQEARSIAKANLENAQAKQKRAYDKKATTPSVRVGSLVALNPRPGSVDIGPKMARRKRAFYRVIEQLGPVTFRIEACPGTDAEGQLPETVHVNRLTPVWPRDAF